jgi:uncharacterized protein YbjT (DUF2867 family)
LEVLRMGPILVTGGTGHLGRDLVSFLEADGHGVRVLARIPGDDPAVEWVQGDLATGRGVAEAVAGAQTIVHAATFSPMARRGGPRPVDFFQTPTEVDVEGTRGLLAEAKRAAVGHFLHVSIVGLEHLRRLPYARVKLAAEDLVRESGVPWSIARATPFYWLLDRMLAKNLARLPVWPLLADLPFQPVDSKDFAEYLVECLADGTRGDREEFGGPEIMSLGELVAQYRDARDLRRPILRLPLPAATARKLGAGFTCPAGRRGRTTWSTWLGQRWPVQPSADKES